MNGTIKRIVRDRGFGFLLGDDGMEYFFHHAALENANFETLQEGAKVTFEEAQGKGGKGPRAESVKVR
jgi:CspA family cold shock protein